MVPQSLYVIIAGKPAGVLSQDATGVITFRYFDDYDGIPLSIRMPTGNTVYRQEVIKPYLFGLLPDDEAQRKAIARDFGCRPNNPVALLSHIGLDCPGAVQFCEANAEALRTAIQRVGSYVRLSEGDIARRLRSIRSSDGDSWIAQGERWSLAGNQGKFALALHEGQWCACHGSAATTHIFKNGVVGYSLQALNEYVCMRTATRCGVIAADVSYRFFENEPALIITRYDRVERQQSTYRLHQEDLCQALGVYPDQKYTSDGGPTTYDVLGLLAATGANATANLRTFTEQLFFNYLIGAPDAHAKNYSLILSAGNSSALAPLYDVASGLAYEGMARKGRLAMAIGGENRFMRVGRTALERYAGARSAKVAEAMRTAGLDYDGCKETILALARRIPPAMEEVFEEAIVGMGELREHLLPPIRESCEAAVRMLGE